MTILTMADGTGNWAGQAWETLNTNGIGNEEYRFVECSDGMRLMMK